MKVYQIGYIAETHMTEYQIGAPKKTLKRFIFQETEIENPRFGVEHKTGGFCFRVFSTEREAVKEYLNLFAQTERDFHHVSNINKEHEKIFYLVKEKYPEFLV